MLTLFLLILGWPMSANAQLRTAPVQGQYEVRAEFDYWTTNANFPTNGGSSQAIAYGGNLTSLSGRGEFSYDFDSQFRAYAGFSGGQTNATNVVNQALSGFQPGTQSGSVSGLNEAWVGGQYYLSVGQFAFVPQVALGLPFWRVDETSNDPLLGDGATWFAPGAWLITQLGDFTPFVYGDYKYRDSGYSGLLDYALGIHYAYKNSFWAEAQLDGFTTGAQDSNTANRQQRNTYLTGVDGGSMEFYSINPARGELAGLVGFQFDSFGIYAGLNKTVYGQSSADGWGAIVGLKFDGNFLRQPKPAPRARPPV